MDLKATFKENVYLSVDDQEDSKEYDEDLLDVAFDYYMNTFWKYEALEDLSLIGYLLSRWYSESADNFSKMKKEYNQNKDYFNQLTEGIEGERVCDSILNKEVPLIELRGRELKSILKFHQQVTFNF